jgi:hypothetical protein
MNNKDKLEKLKKRNLVLKPIVLKGVKTSKELDEYRLTIPNERSEYYANLEQIEALEWELKTPAEKKEILRQRELSKLKREGKL